MTYCFQALIAFSSVARRDDVLADINSRISTKPRWGNSTAEVAVSKSGDPAILLTLRFTIRADQEDLIARIQAFAVGVRTPLPGSWIRLHDCTHDESTQPCAVASVVTW